MSVFVYVMGYPDRSYGHCLKVGVAEDVERRRKQLQTASPATVEIFGRIECPTRAIAVAIEKGYAAAFARWHLTGEWFGGMAPEQVVYNALRIAERVFEANGLDSTEGTIPEAWRALARVPAEIIEQWRADFGGDR